VPLNDVTRWFKSPAVDWTLRGHAFASQFEGRVEAVRGVYAYIDTNSSRLPIYDKNGPGKVIVFGSTTALKFGKFLGGVPGRMLQNYDHFHRRRADGTWEDGIFPRVLTCLFVLDLTHRVADTIRSLETEWNRSIRAELRNRALIHPEHRGRAETVNLARPISSAELLALIQPIAARIDP
jgi:hypothetical protein